MVLGQRTVKDPINVPSYEENWRRREGSNLWPGPSYGLSDQRVAAVGL